MSDDPRVAVLGVGWLGEVILRRWLAAGYPRDALRGTHRRDERLAALRGALGIALGADNAAAVRDADVVVLAVRPQQVRGLLRDISGALRAHHVVVSLAAAHRLEDLRPAVGAVPALCRVMLPLTVVSGAGPFFASTDVAHGDARIRTVDALFSRLGESLEWYEDRSIDALLVSVGALPPYLGLFLSALTTWLVDHGDVPRDEARALLLRGLRSVSARFGADGSFDAGLVHARTSGGLTAAAMAAFAAHDFERVVAAGPAAMLARSAELREAVNPPR